MFVSFVTLDAKCNPYFTRHSNFFNFSINLTILAVETSVSITGVADNIDYRIYFKTNGNKLLLNNSYVLEILERLCTLRL